MKIILEFCDRMPKEMWHTDFEASMVIIWLP